MAKYTRLKTEEKDMIYKLYEEKMELRKIARIMKRALSIIQYHLKKNKNLFRDI